MASRKPRTVIEKPPLPGGLEAMVSRSQALIKDLDELRAACYVTQLANAHSDSDAFTVREGEPLSYAQRFDELDKLEQQLRERLPKVVLDQIPPEDRHAAS